MNIEAGDIILVRGKTPIVSSLIRWFTGSEYTHVGIAVSPYSIYEIDIDKQMGIHPIEHEDFDVFRYKYHLNLNQKEKMKEFAILNSRKNEGYDWIKVIAFGLEKIFKAPFIFDKMNKKVCSEIVDEIYAAAGIDLIPNRPNGHVRPGDIAQSELLYKVPMYQEHTS